VPPPARVRSRLPWLLGREFLLIERAEALDGPISDLARLGLGGREPPSSNFMRLY
jgi:hypothetical protein